MTPLQTGGSEDRGPAAFWQLSPASQPVFELANHACCQATSLAMVEEIPVMDELLVGDTSCLLPDGVAEKLVILVDATLVEGDEECSVAFEDPCEEAQLATTASSSTIAESRSG